MKRKHILLAVVLVVVVASIFFLQSMKAGPAPDSEVEEVERGVVGVEIVESELPSDYIPDEQVIAEKSTGFELAPELTGIAGHINTEPGISIESLRGKVVLVDFWTYTCINCIRTLPYLKSWHEMYADDGLVVLGVHTPEFNFEKDYDNVVAAANKYSLEYPIVQDNDYRTWRAFKNRYWPRKYLVDIDGFIRYDHIGEGGYDETENVIQELLAERADRMGTEINLDSADPEGTVDVEFGRIGTPEIYFGYGFTRGNFGNPEGFKQDKVVHYELPADRGKNKAYIEGDWRNDKDGMELISDRGKIVLQYNSKVVNIVAGADSPSEIKVFVDGEPVDAQAGAHVSNGVAMIEDHDLYNLVDDVYGEHLLEIDAKAGFRIFTFTFG